MEFMLSMPSPAIPAGINYRDPILLSGSCFTEHIGGRLKNLKFDILQNPNGILFDPSSVSSSLVSYIRNTQYGPGDLFYLNECWHSWQHHSVFSHIDREAVIRKINHSQEQAHLFLKRAKWLIITLGTSFSYRLNEQAPENIRVGITAAGQVANCHRAPAQWFEKHLMTMDEINAALDDALHQLMQFNPSVRILFTVSPVRHIRDGLIENNRSKARLIEAVHHLAGKFDRIHYFPAYEWVIDVLRDYRFFDLDMVHPNYQATDFVLNKFKTQFIDEESQELMQEMAKLKIARNHKPFQPDTLAHQQFLQTQLRKVQDLAQKYPDLDLREELNYFSCGRD